MLNESDEATREHFYMCNWATGFYPTKATLYIGSKFIGGGYKSRCQELESGVAGSFGNARCTSEAQPYP